MFHEKKTLVILHKNELAIRVKIEDLRSLDIKQEFLEILMKNNI